MKRNLHRCSGAVLLMLALVCRATAASPRAAPTTQPVIEFLDAKAGGDALVDDKAEPYFALLQPREIAAKVGETKLSGTVEEQRAEFIKRCRAATRDFTDAEQRVI